MDLYTCFVNNLFSYLTKRDSVTLRGGIIKKHDAHLSKGDLSFPSNLSSWKYYLPSDAATSNVGNGGSAQILSTTDDFLQLREASKSWCLHVAQCCFLQNDLIVLHLDRVQCFQSVLADVFTRADADTYGRSASAAGRSYFIESDVDDATELDLTGLRLKLLKVVSCNLIQFYGHDVAAEQTAAASLVRITCRSKSKRTRCDDVCTTHILCGPVVNVSDGKKCEKTITPAQLYSKREMDMRLLGEHKYGVRVSSMAASWQRQLFTMLGDAAVTIEMLQIRPSSTLRMNLNDPHHSNNKGASFVMYNCARIASIINKFEREMLANRLEVPPFEHIDMSLLNQPEEWDLLNNYILHFPLVIKQCVAAQHSVSDTGSLMIQPHHLCSFLFGLCSKFSVYYRRVRVLTSYSRSHMLPTMYARIYLLKAIQIVLHNALRLLNIQPVTQM